MSSDSTAPESQSPTLTPTTIITPEQLLSRAQHRAKGLGWSQPVRHASPLGTIDAGLLADVDSAGSVSLRDHQWTIDIWIGAEDRWHFLPTEATVRQAWVRNAPVVETRVRVPGGDIIARAFAARIQVETVEDSGVVIEVENQTGVPVALGFAIRAHDLDGTPRRDLTTLTFDGPRILFNGDPLMYLSRHPSRVIGGSRTELLDRLNDEVQADPFHKSGDQTFQAADGVEGVAIVPLPHTQVVKALLPRPVKQKRRVRPSTEHLGVDWHAPEAESVASGWQLHIDAGAHFSVEDPLVESLQRSSIATLLSAGTDRFGDIPRSREEATQPSDTGGRFTAAQRAAILAEFYHRFGYSDAAEPLARALIAAQGIRKIVRLQDKSDGTLALLWVTASLLGGKKADQWHDDLIGPVAKALHAIDTSLRRGKSASFIASLGGKRAVISALANLGPALAGAGQPDVAARTVELVQALEPIADSNPTAANSTASPHTQLDATLAGWTLEALQAIRQSDVSPEREAAYIAAMRCHDHGVIADRNDNNVPAGSWGFDPIAVASRLLLIADTAVVDDFEGIDILHGIPKVWLGRSLEANRFVTSWGTVSYAIRWHGENAALLWEITPHDSIDTNRATPRLTATSLDPTWEGSGWSGEGLLRPTESWLPENYTPTEVVMEHPDPLEILGRPQREDDDGSGRGDATDVPSDSTSSSNEVNKTPEEGDSFS